MIIEPNDIATIIDMLKVVDEDTEMMSASEAAEWRTLLAQVKAKVTETFSLVDTQLLKLLDGQPIQRGNVVFVKDRDLKYRPEQSKIAGAVIHAAAFDPITGEIRDTRTAVEFAVALMSKLYVSPSVEPKVGGLEALGLSKTDVGAFEEGKPKVKEMVVGGKD